MSNLTLVTPLGCSDGSGGERMFAWQKIEKSETSTWTMQCSKAEWSGWHGERDGERDGEREEKNQCLPKLNHKERQTRGIQMSNFGKTNEL